MCLSAVNKVTLNSQIVIRRHGNCTFDIPLLCAYIERKTGGRLCRHKRHVFHLFINLICGFIRFYYGKSLRFNTQENQSDLTRVARNNPGRLCI